LLELLPLVDNPSRELQAFVKGRGLDDLPETEQRWQVEEPVIYHPPPPTYIPREFSTLIILVVASITIRST